jgi:hypothetical protein
MRARSKFGVVGVAALAGISYGALSSGPAWAQYLTRSEFAQPRAAPPAKFQQGRVKHPTPTAFALQPAPAQPAAPTGGPVTIPSPDANSVLGAALAACDKRSEGLEPIALPSARGDMTLDRCYRGRDHLVCTFNALLAEGKSLLDKYTRITQANYPELGDLDAVCRIKPATLGTDFESAVDFGARFKAWKTQYDARLNCAGTVQQSFHNVTLTDMAQAPDLVKSMIDTIDGDTKTVADLQSQVAGLAEKVDAAQKAMNTIQKVHRSMCARNEVTNYQSRAFR